MPDVSIAGRQAIITDFSQNHIKEAIAIAHANYMEERCIVPILPPVDTLPDMSNFAENGLGVAMLENGHMTGFLCCYKPWEAVTANARGTFSPIHAHGAISKNREMIYRRIYQAAAGKWVKQGVSWHAIGLYAHDIQAIKAFYTYGFGLRCMDAIRPMKVIECTPCAGYTFRELALPETTRLLPLKNMLIEHLGRSPSFMYFRPITETVLEAEHNARRSRYFGALKEDLLVAFIEVMDRGENFACDDVHMKNICGAFCLPEHRGSGLYRDLLNFTISVLKTEGYARLGVDFESFNPTACGFWLKYFTAYTNSVVRRIDERILAVNG